MFAKLLEFISVVDILMLAVGLVSVVLGIYAIVMARKSEKPAAEMHGAAVKMNKDTQDINRDIHQMTLLAEQFTMHPLEMDTLREGQSTHTPNVVTLRKDTYGDTGSMQYTHEDIARVMRDLQKHRIPAHTVIIDELPAFLSDGGLLEKDIQTGNELADFPQELLQLRVALAKHGIRLALFPPATAAET